VAGEPARTRDRRRLGAAMIVSAALVTLFAIAVSERFGLFVLVIIGIAAFNFVRGLLWLLRPS
jgi:hypothetical protein